jgi:extradiol dioxygenase family protein
MRPRFHLAIPVDDLEAARGFYVDLLGCGVGRESDRWIDLDFHGHQVTVHRVDAADAPAATNPVDGHAVPTRHFGAILDVDRWEALARTLTDAGVDFLIEPHVRFAGTAGEQRTLFLLDPAGNGVEFKAFVDDAMVFAREGFEHAGEDGRGGEATH